jgi:N-acyl-D-aspartate/D-glutamate deacylase
MYSSRTLLMFDVLIKNALFFDGSGAPGVLSHLGICDGKLLRISTTALDETGCDDVIDASNRWVTPGFIDTHTH